MNFPLKLLNLPANYYRRNLWRFHLNRWQKLNNVEIDRPIFLLGVQGGGLTLLARMLRRHSQTVSVTGNSTYWAGPDEMQNVMGRALPASLTGLHYKIPTHSVYPQRDGIYAINDLLPLYRETADNTAANHQEQLVHLIRLALSIYSNSTSNTRFIDKSQTFTVRLSLINKYLHSYHPHFILVTRNPYALCYRYATRIRSLTTLNLTLKERLQLAGQHWSNSMRCALEDAQQVQNFKIVAFEQLLTQPQEMLQNICLFLDLPYRQDMLPAPEHEFPLGATGSSKGDHKWYPLRPDVNTRYLEKLKPWMIDILRAYVGPLSSKWRYTPEGP